MDLDAVDHNIRRVVTLVRDGSRAGRTPKVRVASKSIRCPEILAYVLEGLGDLAGGVMTYTAAETEFLAGRGFNDLILAYPTARARDAKHIATANVSGASAAVVVDAVEHLALLNRAGADAQTVIPVVVDLDVAWRFLCRRGYVGVRRSPLASPDAVLEIVQAAGTYAHVRVHGLMAYEAHIAGISDCGHGALGPVMRWIKARSRPATARLREATVALLRARGYSLAVVNGAGTGSLAAASRERCLTEVTAGSGFLDSHLFDCYDGLVLTPAAGFAVQVVRRPRAGMVTCHGGGYVASGGHGRDRLPMPWLPPGLNLLAREGAGEVQTPLTLEDGVRLDLGDPVFFRHAKAGELAEHFNAYAAVRGETVTGRYATYRGLGQCFLG